MKRCLLYETYEETVMKMKKSVLQRNSGLSTPNILARKSKEVPLSYCRTGAKSEGNNQPGLLVSQ
jgi:hypothetical protein